MKKNLFRLVLGLVLGISFFSAADYRISAGRKEAQDVEQLMDLTTRIAALSSRLQGEKSESDSAVLELRQLAERRFAKMSEMIDKNPSDVFRAVLPPDVLAKIPAQLQPYFEKE
jgi:hypothetical protein